MVLKSLDRAPLNMSVILEGPPTGMGNEMNL